MEKEFQLDDELTSLEKAINEIMDGCNCTEEQAEHLLARSYAMADYIIRNRNE